MFKKLTVLLLLLVPIFLFAQSSGKIAGVVVDKSTGDPLPGVNVILEGTTMGSSTDIDGYYVILNVPVGVYTIRANYIGYKDVVIENVRVSAGITTEINFQLEPTTLELEEAVVVTAERPLVEKNVTQSISLITNKQIEALPVRGFTNLLQIANSVVVQDNEIHIRGGRVDEVGYYLDGASTVNPLTNRQAVHVIQEAVEEFQVLAGGYTAEFGGANAGIIRTELKTGTQQFHTSFMLETDKFAKEGEKFLGTYSYGHHTGVATISGPLFSKKIRFFLAGENQYRRDRQVRFSKGFEFHNLVDQNPANPAVSGDNPHPDTIAVYKYPDGFTPHNKDNLYAINGTLLFDFQPVRFRIGGVWQSQNTMINSRPMLSMLNHRNVSDQYNSMLITGKLTHVLSPTTYYELNLSYFNSKLERLDDYFDNEWTKWYDSTAVAKHTNGKVIYRDKYRPMYDLLLAGFPIEREGDPSNYYRIQKQKYLGGALDFVSQIGRHHEVKAGLEARKYTLRRFSVQPSAISLGEKYGTYKKAPIDEWASAAYATGYGYDFYGNEIDADKNYGDSLYIEGPKQPMFMAFYVQDKIEFNDLIINAGLRFDYFDTDDKTLKNPANPEIDAKTKYIKKSAWKDVDPFKQVSPRLGFSFPVSERTVFYMQYGKFIQMPRLNNIYFSSYEYRRQIVVGGNYYLNPVGFGIEPVRTTSYEIGFRQQLSAYAAFDVSGFYRNVKGQVQLDKVRPEPGALIQAYDVRTNGDFATTKGMEFRLTLRRVNRVMAQVNYTYTSAEGTGSSETSYHGAVYRVTEKPTIVRPLDYNQKHRGSIVLDYRFGKNDGGPIFQRFGANLLFTFSSGHPYTLVYFPPGGQVNAYNAGVDYMLDTRSRQALEPLNASTTPWTFNVDMRLDKSFTLFSNLDLTLYVRVTNLFNTKNVINVYQATGNAYDDGFINNPTYSQGFINQYGEQYVEMYKAINIENGQSYWSEVGRQLFDHPRQIFFGIQLTY